MNSSTTRRGTTNRSEQSQQEVQGVCTTRQRGLPSTPLNRNTTDSDPTTTVPISTPATGSQQEAAQSATLAQEAAQSETQPVGTFIPQIKNMFATINTDVDQTIPVI